MSSQLQLPDPFTFEDLYTTQGLQRLDAYFLAQLGRDTPDLCGMLYTARTQGTASSDFLVALAPYVEIFIRDFFHIGPMGATLKEQALCRRLFIQRIVSKRFTALDATHWDGVALCRALEDFLGAPYNDDLYVRSVLGWLDDDGAYADALEAAARYGAWRLYSSPKVSKLFWVPEKVDYHNLVCAPQTHIKRDGFSLLDAGLSADEAALASHYCLHCHVQEKDSCRKGLQRQDRVVQNPLGLDLHGCPLDEKISEMLMLKSKGFAIGALAVAMVDNPLLAATGHRICNDCMKACVFQKQEPVNIPGAETGILKEVLDLPYGVEIYSLLTRWNPLHITRPLPKPATDYKVLVVGAGPAGFNLAHHLLQEGHGIVVIEGLKVEPYTLPFKPIHSFDALSQPLASRVPQGFGGVMEYGITTRWNKNYLTLIRMLLERRSRFVLQGGVRLESQLTTTQAFAQGFDHVALCMGAGKPSLPEIPGVLSMGVKTASDFLMHLQAGGAFLKTHNVALQVRLPAIVVGGGLTSIDAATELLAYYPLQVERLLQRVEQYGPDIIDPGDQAVADEMLRHGKLLRKERARGGDIVRLLQGWGGVSILYRRSLQQSPAYRLNHEEVQQALNQGIHIMSHHTPLRVEEDESGVVAIHTVTDQGVEERLPCRTLLWALGTQPNTVMADETPMVCRDGQWFALHNTFFAGSHALGKSISVLGDLHPKYAGNVVKAMASSKDAYPLISADLAKAPPSDASWGAFIENFQGQYKAHIHAIHRLAPRIIEVIVQAPAAAKRFQPGQFFKLQQLSCNATSPDFIMEGIAVTGAEVDAERGLVSVIVLEMGVSTQLLQTLKVGEEVVLMGPTGTPTEIPKAKRVLLIGGGLGNAVLFSIGAAMRGAGCHVTYIAGYRSPDLVFKRASIEAACDAVIWCTNTGAIDAQRPQDCTITGTVLDGLALLGDAMLGDAIAGFDHVLTIGSDSMMAAVAGACRGQNLKPGGVLMASINAPMQCMMKEICGQCLQRHEDPKTGEVSYVFSCHRQDQNMLTADFPSLKGRLSASHLMETVNQNCYAGAIVHKAPQKP